MVLQCLVSALWNLHDWDKIYLLLPKLPKAGIFREDYERLELEVYCALLLKITWSCVPSHLQKSPKLVAIYVQQLLVDNKAEQAEDILKMILRKNLDKNLLELYANLPSGNPIKKLARAEEAWLQNNNEDPALFLALGRICKQQKLWGKARQYFQRSANLFSCPEVYFELGQICEMQNDLVKALEFYKKGIKNIAE
jgi:HemY protein